MPAFAEQGAQPWRKHLKIAAAGIVGVLLLYSFITRTAVGVYSVILSLRKQHFTFRRTRSDLFSHCSSTTFDSLNICYVVFYTRCLAACCPNTGGGEDG
jgi:hypothetical protein